MQCTVPFLAFEQPGGHFRQPDLARNRRFHGPRWCGCDGLFAGLSARGSLPSARNAKSIWLQRYQVAQGPASNVTPSWSNTPERSALRR